ncbi:MAG: DoxX family protein [Actinobacteria bacterium]|nr:DoxX family protein [Actinomycetota bacterium]
MAASLGILILRVGAGIGLASHGWNKFFGGGRIPGTARWFESIGMRPGTGKICAVMAASTELGSGVLIALGLLTPFAAAGMVAVMFVAAWTVHLPNGFFSAKDGYELNFVLGLSGVAIATVGAGRFSVDQVLGLAFRWNGPIGLAIALVIGIGGAAAQLAVFFRRPTPKES